jgi:hypothetical protein
MDSNRKAVRRALALAAVGALGLGASVAACTGGVGDGDDVVGGTPGGPGGPGSSGAGGPVAPPDKTILDERTVDYGEALRTASLKLVDRLPTLAEIKQVESASDPKTEYEALLDGMLEAPAFRRRMRRFWRDVFRQGGGELDTAPVFAARIVVEGRPYTELFTAKDNTCPTYDDATDTFADGACQNGVAEHAGVLTNPGVMKQFYANMAFRRARWVQEIFACTKFPAEYRDTPVPMGAGQYTSPWPFESVAKAPVDFQDTSAVVCANCHTTMNHLAPLFANFDAEGQLQPTVSVMTPLAPEPVPTELGHWLVPGEATAWRLGVPVATLPELGQALAADPDVHACLVARLWNFTMSKEDIVTDLATVPATVLAPFVAELEKGGFNVKQTLASMLKSEDFVSF